MPTKCLTGSEEQKKALDAFNRHGGNVSAAAREVGVTRATLRGHVRAAGWAAKPLVAGQVARTEAEVLPLPPPGRVRRFLLTSAQNNTRVNEQVWRSLNALAKHYEAAIMVGTYSYNTNAYGKLAVKRGKKQEFQAELWYDERLKEHIVDSRVELGNGLVWCGEMNILPTAEDPLSGLETYSHRLSAVFPHAKVAMRSIATMRGEGTKLNYTTGTVTVHNYIQKKAGLKAEHHHSYGALLVEVNDQGNWWCRQVLADDKGRMQDLDVVADGDKIKEGQPVEAIGWGDLHATIAQQDVLQASWDMLDRLRPKAQFLHDVMEGVSVNHHELKNPHARFKAFVRGYSELESELQETMAKVTMYERPWCFTVVVDSNHDSPWINRWLQEYDYRKDPRNAILFLKTQLKVYEAIAQEDSRFHTLEYLMRECGLSQKVKFLREDESFTVCGKKIECGMHGHLGPDGARGTPGNLNKVGRRANTAHTHSAGIYNGLYVGGTSSKLSWDYTKGPSSWTHSHVVTYPNGMRAIVTVWDGRWRA